MMRLLKTSVAVIALTAPFAAHAEVGVLAAVNRDMTGARPSEQARPIFINERLVADETIETSADGGGQVLFLDQTSLTIAPNSSIVLDQYVYNPDAGSGSIGLTVTRGAMRLIGGRITKTNAATIKTPSATIGIRGGMGNVNVNGAETLYMHVAGVASTIDTDAGSLTITREGGLARILQGGAPEFLGIATSDLIQQIFGAASTGSGDGGSPAAAGVAASGGGSVGVSDADGIIQSDPISTTGERQQAEFGELPVELTVSADQEFSDSTFMDAVLDDIPVETDAVGFVGQFSGTVVVDDGVLIPTSFSDGAIFLALSLESGQGAASVAFPFDTGIAPPGGGPTTVADLITMSNGQDGQFTVDPNTALSGAASGTVFLEGNVADGFFNINYNGSVAPLTDAGGGTLSFLSGSFVLNGNPELSGIEAQEFIDLTRDLLGP